MRGGSFRRVYGRANCEHGPTVRFRSIFAGLVESVPAEVSPLKMFEAAAELPAAPLPATFFNRPAEFHVCDRFVLAPQNEFDGGQAEAVRVKPLNCVEDRFHH